MFASNLSVQDKAAYLRTLPSIRERCQKVHSIGVQGELEYFEYKPEKEQDVASFCIGIIKVAPPMSLGAILTKPSS